MYELICLSPDGDSVREGQFDTIGAAWERNDNMGSRWIFYPHRVVTVEDIVVSTADGYEWMNGVKLSELKITMQNDPVECI